MFLYIYFIRSKTYEQIKKLTPPSLPLKRYNEKGRDIIITLLGKEGLRELGYQYIQRTYARTYEYKNLKTT